MVRGEQARVAARHEPAHVKDLRRYTAARVGLGRAGNSVPTREVLDFGLAHARARDAVHYPLDVSTLFAESEGAGWPSLILESAARDRGEYLRRPDLGRKLNDASKSKLEAIRDSSDVVFIITDGLSALAVHNHALAVLRELMPLLDEGWRPAPIMIVRFGRVAVGDAIGAAIDTAISVVLIGERPGLSSPDSLGIYLTWNPRPGCRDSERNCISNIHGGGLSHGAAAHLLAALMNESRTRRLSGIDLKAPTLAALPDMVR
jgi:ethanolamine ammonia-lyase small subunit